MKYSRQNFFSNTAIALSAFLSFSLLACDESNPTSFDSPVAYSEAAPGTSNALESSSSEGLLPESSGIASSSSSAKQSSSSEYNMYERCIKAFGIVTDDCFSSECNAENEGKVETLWLGNEKYGGNSYYRCKRGSWVEGDISLTCDTAGVQVGDTCTKYPKLGIFAAMNSMPGSNAMKFIYKGNGVWKKVEDSPQEVVESSSSVETYSSSSSSRENECEGTDGEIGDVCADSYISFISYEYHGVNYGPIIISCYIYTETGWKKIMTNTDIELHNMGYSGSSESICKEIAAGYENPETPVDSVTVPADTAAAE